LPILYLTPFVGAQWQPSSIWSLGFEFRVAGINHENDQEALKLLKPFGSPYGVVAPVLMLSYHFGAKEASDEK
jgi:hypothetical protein